MKRLMLLGDSAQQVIAIETAKKQGYYTVFYDYWQIIWDSTMRTSSNRSILPTKSMRQRILSNFCLKCPIVKMIKEKLYIYICKIEIHNELRNKVYIR